MENEELQEQEQVYEPRPRWQVFMAWIALVIFVGFLIMYYTNIFRS